MQLSSENINLLRKAYDNSFVKKGVREGVSKNGSSVAFTGLRDELIDVSKDALKLANSKYRDRFIDKAQMTFGESIQYGITGFFRGAKDKAVKFFKENFTEGIDVTYENRNRTLEYLRKNFGETFDDCFLDIDNYNNTISSPRVNKFTNFVHSTLKTIRGKKDKFVYEAADETDSITFHKDPFIKNLCLGIKEFTVGQILDLGVSVRNLYRKLDARFGSSDIISSTRKRTSFINEILDRRISENKARDAFYRLSGVFEEATKGVSDIGRYNLKKNPVVQKEEALGLIESNIKKLAEKSIGQASKKVGKYNTKTERAWNRLGTGFVSATFAATDFYNISMLQNNDPNKANKSGKKRFWQDMRRQGLTAGITYVILGALQRSVNNSVMAAVLSLGGVTLASEILSRKMGGIPLTPLTPEDAAKVADKQEKKRLEKEGLAASDNQNEDKKEENKPAQTTTMNNDIQNNSLDVFKVFTDKVNNPSSAVNASTPFTSNVQNAVLNDNDQNSSLDVFKVFTDKTNYSSLKGGALTSFTSNSLNNVQKEPEENKEGKKKSSIASKIIKATLGVFAASLAVGFLRTKNVGKINDIINSINTSYTSMKKKIISKRLILPSDDVDGFLNYLKDNHFMEQHKVLENTLNEFRRHGKLSGQTPSIQKYIPKKELNPSGFYYDLGYVDSKAKKTAFNVITYPINAVAKIFGNANNLVRRLLGAAPIEEKSKEVISSKNAAEFMEKYAHKYRDALAKEDIYSFRKELEDAFTRHFSEANSKNKNTSIAMISRFLITIISGYFFVNDYRNEVLIESKGKDVERANSTMRERIGHKIANFFLNSMFMDLFNTTFESFYLGSVGGATAVAMATEFTNETAVRASICTPTSKMTREELIEYEDKRLNDDSIKGDYYRTFMKITGKKPLSEKAKK